MDTHIKAIIDATSDYCNPIRQMRAEQWIMQFPMQYRDIVLHETAHLVKKYYYSREECKILLTKYVKKFLNPRSLQLNVSFLKPRLAGSSQEAMYEIMKEVLNENWGIDIQSCNGKDMHYLDDASFSGSTVHRELSGQSGQLTLVHLANYKNIKNYHRQAFKSQNAQERQEKTLNQWRGGAFFPKENEDFKEYVDSLPMPEKVTFRRGEAIEEKMFTSEECRNQMEYICTMKGIEICKDYSIKSARPLGLTPLSSLGFGAFFATYRNMANNCPLVYWGRTSNWKPLFEVTRRAGRYDA